MKQLFVPYEIAKLLKEKSFNEPCFAVIYPDGQIIEQHFEKLVLIKEEICYALPLYQQVIDWFRTKHIKIIESPQYGWDIYVNNSDKGEYFRVYLLKKYKTRINPVLVECEIKNEIVHSVKLNSKSHAKIIQYE